ncbi:hypothetical protein NEIELOOT_02757 [Neisseria elongata subsp. glycolytica ATCC 29315]|uniref:Uncharacterized protein n=1 Tax=Neisseria elongata subsp. glycolytica ATCC 29315 TaxID=546263 RepID=D4DUS4_NEIEG|nr:hypothetical protein NEIELOOT_02757 [Neisseria elongata subsp. glycolytica ATCC 29315]
MRQISLTDYFCKGLYSVYILLFVLFEGSIMTKSILSRMFFRRPSNAGRPSEKCMKQGVSSLFLLYE